METKTSFQVAFCCLLSVEFFSVVFGQQPEHVAGINFYLYKTPGPSEGIIVPFGRSDISPITPNTQTFLVIDGFLQNYTQEMSQTVKDGLLKAVPSANVIVVDWAQYSGALSGLRFTSRSVLDVFRLLSLYEDVVKYNVQYVGRHVAAFLQNLKVYKNIDFSQVHVVGHSLGAQIGGTIGLEVSQTYGGRLSRISALDPAGLSYQNEKNLKRKLDPGDADFVDVYHTTRSFGNSEPGIGHVNLYINGGKGTQPGCSNELSILAVLCNHVYSWRVWNLSLNKITVACPCTSVTNCECQTCDHSCSRPLPIGLRMPKSARGDFYLQTTSKAPVSSILTQVTKAQTKYWKSVLANGKSG